jgi:phosphate transport system protein
MTLHLTRDLDMLKREILTMGAMVQDATNKAIASLIQRSPELAEEVMDGDDAIDQKELTVEDACLKILALHQPVAGDLRFIVVSLKVNSDLERMGDHAQNIAERSLYLSTHDAIPVDLDFARMLDRVREMVSMSLDALVQRSPQVARRVCSLDDEVDRYNRNMFDVLQSLMRREPDTIERAVQTLSVGRHLERIADLATNIAEEVVFMVEGEVIRHHLESPPGVKRQQ